MATADDYIKNRTKMSGTESGKAARYTALQKLIDLRKRHQGGTKATGLQPGDVDVEQSITPARRRPRG